ncbi:MAG: hypothetical protein WC364_13045 [Eubacteriales bacterium]
MKDQYGQAIPADLKIIPEIGNLTQDEIILIDNLDWYEMDGFILVPENEVGGDDPLDAGLAVDKDGNMMGKVMKIDQVLHRYNKADGFYHA